MSLSWPLLRRAVTFLAAILLGLAVLWGVMWTVAAAQYRNLVDNWIAAEKARGHEISYNSRKTGGFPRTILLRFRDVRWDDAAGGKAQVAELTLAARPWRWRVFNAQFAGGAEVTVPFPEAQDPLTLRGASGEGHVELTEQDQWGFARFRLAQASASRPSHDLFTAEELELAAERPDVPAQTYRETGLSLSAKTRGMGLKTAKPMPFGDTISSGEVAWRVMGPPPDVFSKASVAAWNNASGVVECDALNLNWGPLLLEAKGTLALDDDLQPEGAFSGQIGGHEAVIAALQEQGWIAQRQAGMLNSALGLFAKPSKLTGTPSSIEVPITVQLGGLFLGPVRIFTFPHLVWPEESGER